MLCKLFCHFRINNSVLFALINACLSPLALLVLNFHILSFFSVKVNTVLVDVPLREGSSVDLYDAVLDEGVGSYQFVVGSVVDNVQDTSLTGSGF